MWGYYFLSIFILIAGSVFLNWIFYDLLIQIESSKFPLEWAKDGEPIGIFHTPADIPTFRGSVSRKRQMTKWIFQKPDWIKRDIKAKKFYTYFRLAGIAYFSLTFLLFLSFVVIFLIQP